MRSDSLVHQHLPTPPMNSTECQTALSQIVQYNTDGNYAISEISYGSPGTMIHGSHPSQVSRTDSHSGGPLGLGIEYDGYGPASDHLHDGLYHVIQNNQDSFSPPTPRSTTDDDFVRRANGHGQNVAPATPPLRNDSSPIPKAQSRILKTPRTRKPKAGKADKPKTPKLTAPLSILTKSLLHIPVKNMEEWVNRTADTRRKEVEKRNGYITRPMNSFMLYRSAYAERAKSWCLQNNHQIVSSVAGESWPLEPAAIRELYNEYAKIERINHQNAHPTYKFSPSKTAVPARKRKSEWSDGEPSDLEDTEWAPGSGRSRSRQAKRIERSLSYPDNGFAMGEFLDPRYGSNRHSMNASSWEMTNEARQMTMTMPHNELYSQFVQTSTYPAMHMNSDYTDDAHMRRMAAPAPVSFSSDNSLIGLPSGSSGDFMQQYQSHGNTPFDEGQLDPMLLASFGGHADIDPTAFQHGYRPSSSGPVEDKFDPNDLESLLTYGGAHEEYRAGSWQSDPTMATLEQGSQFGQWEEGEA